MMHIVASQGPKFEPTNFQLIVDSVPALIYTSLPDGYLDFFSQTWLKFVGLSLEDLQGWKWTAVIHPEDVEGIVSKWRASLASGEPFLHQARVRRVDGEYRWMLHHTIPLRDEHGEIVKWYGTLLDIEDRKRAEDSPRLVLDSTPALILTALPDGSLDFFNRTGLRYVGLSSEHMVGWKWTAVIHPEDVEEIVSKWRASLASGEPFLHEARVRRADGEYRWMLHHTIPLRDEHGEIVKWYGSSIDIEDRKQMEQALKRSEAYLSEAQRLSHTGSFAYSPGRGKTLYWSEELFRICGLDSQHGIPDSDVTYRLLHPDDRDRVSEDCLQGFREKAQFSQDYRLLLHDGTVKHLHVIWHPVLDKAGEVVEYVGTAADVTQRKQAEERLRQEEMELRQIVEAVPQHIFVLEPDGKFLYANRRDLEYTGLTLEAVLAPDYLARVWHPDDLEKLLHDREQVLAGGVPWESEARLLGKDGQYRWFLIHLNPLRDEQGRIIRWYGTRTDIEDRKQAEKGLQKALAELKKLKDQLDRENIALREEIDKASMFEEFVCASPALKAVLASAMKVAPSDSTVLITGETGTGKELVARAIHKRSQRSSRAFVSVNFTGIPRDLIASELFGHEKGAFTGATHRRLGRFELAEGGTIFLDEIGELPGDTQVALLRVLQEREFERVGGDVPIRCDVRVIAATNRDLQAAIAAGTFRSDLFYRINVFPIEIPPLRQRREGIPLLVAYFINRYATKLGKHIRGVNANSLALLQSYDWPGNVRELQNVIERSVILCETEELEVDESWLARKPDGIKVLRQPLAKSLATQEKEIIEEALAECGGRVYGRSGAAAKLGMPPSTLDSKIKSLKIDKKRF